MPSKQSQTTLRIIFALALLAVGIYWYWQQERDRQPAVVAPGDYLFCFWNAENLFDDKNNEKDMEADAEYDDWYSSSPADLKFKLKQHTDVLLALNGGKGPDIIALVEVEGEGAAELLMEALNRELKDSKLHYNQVVMREVKSGRHIAPVILTRPPLSVVGDRTVQLGGKVKRTLKVHLRSGDAELIVIATHWRSRLEDKKTGSTGEEQRLKYAQDIYGDFKAAYLSKSEGQEHRNIDVLVCGDLNDDPTDASVTEGLRATGDLDLVKQNSNDPYLFNLMAGKDLLKFGTHYYDRKKTWHIFDQIIVSPGMLDDKGWSCKPATVQTIRQVTAPDGRNISLIDPDSKAGGPWNFGKQNRKGGNAVRGYSDHFPVTVVLSVKGNTPAE